MYKNQFDFSSNDIQEYEDESYQFYRAKHSTRGDQNLVNKKCLNGRGDKKNPDPRFHAIETITELVKWIKRNEPEAIGFFHDVNFFEKDGNEEKIAFAVFKNENRGKINPNSVMYYFEQKTALEPESGKKESIMLEQEIDQSQL